MNHPSSVGPQQKRADLSPLMEAKTRASAGEKVNFCPFGCTLDDLDEAGLCVHLVGYTVDGKHMEPLKEVKGRRTVQVEKDAAGKPVLVPVPAGAKLERITTSYRVYHDLAGARKKGGN